MHIVFDRGEAREGLRGPSPPKLESSPQKLLTIPPPPKKNEDFVIKVVT
jgi:hypothetical protein